MKRIVVILVLYQMLSASLHCLQAKEQPNVILIMTDDQGYSHLSCQGHPHIKTPNIDCFADDAVRLTDFHQEILCAPSRSALLTGRYSARTGAWRTSAGRAIMRSEETTIAEFFKANGYRTGHFGKWHLGDNYPFRSQDQGFEEVVAHKCGGVGQISDYWGNDYFDDSYYHNGELKQYKGYCADVWFNETMRYIKEVQDQPFFIYLASNTPHSPYNIASEYVKPFTDQGISIKQAEYYGMISNIDENMGRLLAFLENEGLTDNTIVVFTTDDGASGGAFDTHDGSVDGFPINGFNAGLRGRKASVYEGGHRTFCFLRWPKGKLQGGKDVGGLCGVWDVFPTLADLCNLQIPESLSLDGISLRSQLKLGKASKNKERSLFIQLHGGVGLRHLEGAPHHFIESVVLKEKWRLVNGKELYDLKADPIQKDDIAASHPEVVEQLKKEYESWFVETTKDMNIPCRIVIGSEDENPVELTTQDSYTSNTNSACIVRHVLGLCDLNGPWKIHVGQNGKYSISASRYPIYTNLPMGYNQSNGKTDLLLSKIRLKIEDRTYEKTALKDDVFKTFIIDLEKGDTDMQTWLVDDKGNEYPPYFVLIEKL